MREASLAFAFHCLLTFLVLLLQLALVKLLLHQEGLKDQDHRFLLKPLALVQELQLLHHLLIEKQVMKDLILKRDLLLQMPKNQDLTLHPLISLVLVLVLVAQVVIHLGRWLLKEFIQPSR